MKMKAEQIIIEAGFNCDGHSKEDITLKDELKLINSRLNKLEDITNANNYKYITEIKLVNKQGAVKSGETK